MSYYLVCLEGWDEVYDVTVTSSLVLFLRHVAASYRKLIHVSRDTV